MKHDKSKLTVNVKTDYVLWHTRDKYAILFLICFGLILFYIDNVNAQNLNKEKVIPITIIDVKNNRILTSSCSGANCIRPKNSAVIVGYTGNFIFDLSCYVIVSLFLIYRHYKNNMSIGGSKWISS